MLLTGVHIYTTPTRVRIILYLATGVHIYTLLLGDHCFMLHAGVESCVRESIFTRYYWSPELHTGVYIFMLLTGVQSYRLESRITRDILVRCLLHIGMQLQVTYWSPESHYILESKVTRYILVSRMTLYILVSRVTRCMLSL